MRRTPCPPKILLALLGTLPLAGCDVFSSPGLEDIDISYVGDVDLQRCDTAAFTVTVRASGVLIADPRLEITSSDTTKLAIRLALLPTGDAIVTRDNCSNCFLTIRFLSSWVTDTVPTHVQDINASGGRPACP